MEGLIIGGRYDIKKKIGYGGHGEVYEGVDRESGEKIAAKFEDADQGNLLNEFNAYKLLNGTAGIPKSYYYECIGRYNVLILELMGKTLEDILDDQKPLPFTQAISFAKQLLQTLAHIHFSGIVHFDLKPSNIMTGAGIKNEVIQIVDFGSAHIYTKVEIENNRTIKWFQQRDRYDLIGVILDFLRGARHNTNNVTTSI